MTALAPINHATGGTAQTVLTDAPQLAAREALAPRWAQVGAVGVTIVSGSAAGLLSVVGAGWVAIPLAALSVAVTLGAFVPDVIARRWDRLSEQG